MKLIKSRIKQWDTAKRLDEIEKRLNVVRPYDNDVPGEVMDAIEEIKQIVEFWQRHLDEAVEIPRKKEHKTFNLWTDDPI